MEYDPEVDRWQSVPGRPGFAVDTWDREKIERYHPYPTNAQIYQPWSGQPGDPEKSALVRSSISQNKPETAFDISTVDAKNDELYRKARGYAFLILMSAIAVSFLAIGSLNSTLSQTFIVTKDSLTPRTGNTGLTHVSSKIGPSVYWAFACAGAFTLSAVFFGLFLFLGIDTSGNKFCVKMYWYWTANRVRIVVWSEISLTGVIIYPLVMEMCGITEAILLGTTAIIWLIASFCILAQEFMQKLPRDGEWRRPVWITATDASPYGIIMGLILKFVSWLPPLWSFSNNYNYLTVYTTSTLFVWIGSDLLYLLIATLDYLGAAHKGCKCCRRDYCDIRGGNITVDFSYCMISFASKTIVAFLIYGASQAGLWVQIYS